MMKFKIKKDIFLKKSTWLVLGIFAITLVNIPRFRTQASGTNDPLTFEPDTLQVLEIMPGNESALSNSTTNPNSEEEKEVNGQKVHITHVNMPQFISQTDDIEGKYDVVAITNSKNNNMHENYWVNATYRQYTSPFAEKMDYGKYLSGANNSNMPSYLLSSSQNEEYYPENDITNKRAKLIVDMINKGQLVYIDSSAANVPGTKLNSNFNNSNLDGKTNFKKVPGSAITLDNIVNDYKSITNRRVKVSAGSGPKSEDNSGNTVTNERQLNFSFKVNAEAAEDLTFNVYLDFDGDGLFTGDPYYTTTRKGSNSYQTYDFSTAINNGFIGYLGWKVDIVRPNGVKTSITSYAQYHAQNGPQEIKVLQIYPNNDNWSYYDNRSDVQGTSNTRLTKSETFMKLLGNEAVSKDYNIKIQDISANDFQSTYGESTGKKHLQDDYDMVIIGFADYYAGADISNKDALNDLDNFIKAGKSVMFTHDTIGLGIEGKSSGPQIFAQHYKSLVGQSRYKDQYSAAANICPDISDYKNGSEQVSYTPITYDNSNGKILGQTALTICGTDINDNNMIKDKKGETQNGSRLWETTQTNTVKNINNAQITTYPFNLGEYNKGDGTLNVDLTHTQWYQLNLEDPDIVPWYNLVGGYMDSGDSRNFYYTYSKKNITYSGTGHSGVPNSDQELELFVNTIVKAFRGSNSAPTVTNYSDDSKSTDQIIADNSQVQQKLKATEDYTFYTLPNDADNDKLNVNVEIATNDAVTGKSDKELKEEDLQFKSIKSQDGYTGDEPIKVTIPKEEYANLSKGSTVYVKVTATDPLGEKGVSTFKLICSGNKAPDITNYKASGENAPIADGETVAASRQSNFNFTSVLTDPDEEDVAQLKYSIKVDGNDSIATLMLRDDKVSKDDLFTSGDRINVTIPDSVFDGKNTGDTIKIETTVTDSENQSKTKTFILKIDPEEPSALLSVVDAINDDGSYVDIPNDKKFKNLDIVKLAGKISNVFQPNGTIELEIPKEFEVQGDVTVKRLVDGKLVDLPKNNVMTKGTDGLTYTLDLAGSDVLSLGTFNKEGMTFIVECNAKICDSDKLAEAMKNEKTVRVPDGSKSYKNEDGSITTITNYKVTKTWEYSNAFMSILRFTGCEKDSTVTINTYMNNIDTKDVPEEHIDPPPTPEPIPDNKQYMNVDLF